MGISYVPISIFLKKAQPSELKVTGPSEAYRRENEIIRTLLGRFVY